jgi:hypothetical protein
MMCPFKWESKQDLCSRGECAWFIQEENRCVAVAAYYKTEKLITMLQDYLSRYFQIQAAVNSIKEKKDGD